MQSLVSGFQSIILKHDLKSPISVEFEEIFVQFIVIRALSNRNLNSSSDSESSDLSSSSDGSETSCDVIKTKNVTKDSDDSTDEETSHKAKSQIEILEKLTKYQGFCCF